MNVRDEEPYEAAERFHSVVKELCRKHGNEHFRNGQEGGRDEGEDHNHHNAVGTCMAYVTHYHYLISLFWNE